MTWVRIDDGFARNPKIMALPHKSIVLHVAGLCYCASNLTDGHIPKAAIPMLLAEARVTRAAVKPLVERGVWTVHDGDDGYNVHDYLKYQESRADVQQRRDRWAEKKRRQRSSPDEMSTGDSQGDSTGESPRPIPSHPIPSVTTGTNHHPSYTGGGDDDERFRAVVEAIADDRIKRHPARDNPLKYRTTVVASVIEQQGDAIRAFLASFHPDADAEQAVRRIRAERRIS